MSGANLSVDKQIFFRFEAESGQHARDERPLTIAGRIVSKPEHDLRKGVWRNTPLMQGHGRTGPTPLMSPSDMLVVL